MILLRKDLNNFQIKYIIKKKIGVNMGILNGFSKPNIKKLEREKDVQGLINALKSEDVNIRSEAANAFTRIRDESLVDLLINALDDENTDVRGNAASALGKIGNKKASEIL